MTKLLEIKEQIVRFCGKYETYLKFVYKFFLALILFVLINSAIGFMESISTLPVAFVLAFVCCLLPQSVTLFVAAALVVLNLYVLSIEVAFTALLIFALVFFLYFRFSPEDGVLFVLTPICFALHIPYILPIATGLLRKVYSVAAVACGTIVFFFLDGIYENVTALQATSVGADGMEATKMTITAGQLLANKEMYLTVAVFAISAIVVYVVRKMSIDHAWKVAVASGALVQVSGLFVGYLLFDISGKIVAMLFGNLIAIALGFVMEFVFMNLDYSRTERVQFEDDDYYYFVKAVPKKMVASSDKEVIQFSGFSSLEKIKERRNKTEKPVSRQQIVEELEIDEEFLK
ncbi:MAG: hypothetical protein IJA07_07725 [Agathobacter sp.]|nr:hypothetical protein [Agathobacter sp.]